jgi:hypothetical protein
LLVRIFFACKTRTIQGIDECDPKFLSVNSELFPGACRRQAFLSMLRSVLRADHRKGHHQKQLKAEQYNQKVEKALAAQAGQLGKRDVPLEDQPARLYVPPWDEAAAIQAVSTSAGLKPYRVCISLPTNVHLLRYTLEKPNLARRTFLPKMHVPKSTPHHGARPQQWKLSVRLGFESLLGVHLTPYKCLFRCGAFLE